MGKQLLNALYGETQQPERWKYCISYVNANMGMAVGAIFAKNFFTEKDKNIVQTANLIHYQLESIIYLIAEQTTQLFFEIQKSFVSSLTSADWLDYETKNHAIEKLEKMDLKLGYPDYILEDNLLNSDYNEVKTFEPRDIFLDRPL